jgi:hypothetical protein
MIPFYILFDLDLNANHLRMYGQIEQMESNPDPKVNPTFSYQWFADQLGIDRSNAIRTANVLKNKKYIEHIEIKPGIWLWRTVKAQVVMEDTECPSPNSVAQRHPPVAPSATPPVAPSATPPVAPSATPPVAPSATQRSQKVKSQKINNSFIKKNEPEQNSSTTNDWHNHTALYEQTSSTEMQTTQQSTDLAIPPSLQGFNLTTNDIHKFKTAWDLYPRQDCEEMCMSYWFHDGCHLIADQIIDDIKQRTKKDAGFLAGVIPNFSTYITKKKWKTNIFEGKKKSGFYDYKNTDWASSEHDDIFDKLD